MITEPALLGGIPVCDAGDPGGIPAGYFQSNHAYRAARQMNQQPMNQARNKTEGSTLETD